MENVLKLSTKARTLENLFDKLSTAKVLPVYILTVNEFNNNKTEILNKIKDFFPQEYLIVRSSAINEDSDKLSNAGSYKTCLNVKNSISNLDNAIQEVINSYGSDSVGNEVFIQPMLSNVIASGVALTCDLDTLAPYYIINYDKSGKTDSITSGADLDLETYIYFKESPVDPSDKYLNKIISSLRELEKLLNNTFLDVEFAIDNNEEVVILQVRPIVTTNKKDLSSLDFSNSLYKIYKKVQKLQSPHPNLLGDKSIFGVMPDWNPAEIIGHKPRMLALSLYKELITDNIWAYQRDNYGYRNLRSHPLLVSFLGIPYIDVRVDFNSFIPKDLDNSISEKLVNYYINRLISAPNYHDKVEFKIVYSCYFLNLNTKLQNLICYGFNNGELRQVESSLLKLTNNIICSKEGLFKKDLKKIEILNGKFKAVKDSDLSVIDKIYWLIEDCKRYGTLPFAGIARAAFVAVQFLKSFIDLEIITNSEYESFMNSLNTVSSQLSCDLARLNSKIITKEEFLEKYHHLRPSSYDILSLNYAEGFDIYFSSNNNNYKDTNNFEFTDTQLEKINQYLTSNNLIINANELINFIKLAIESREYSKLVFTRSLSEVLSLIESIGDRFEISRSDLSYLDIKTVLDLYSSLDHRDIYTTFISDINKNKELYKYTEAIKLPGLITKPEDIYSFYLEKEEPNFVSLGKTKAKILVEKDFNNYSFENKIIMIKSADPGYDFLFTKNISGLITQFGGANSHMAIRCAELGIPAVIGAGEKNFNNWSKAKSLEIDCSQKIVRVLS